MTPVLRARSIFTSQDFSWLQNGQVNWVSRVPVIFFLGGGFRFDFLRPMSVGGQTRRRVSGPSKLTEVSATPPAGRPWEPGHRAAALSGLGSWGAKLPGRPPPKPGVLDASSWTP